MASDPQVLERTATHWLRQSFDQGDVNGTTTREYGSDSFSHGHNGIEGARRTLEADYGEVIADGSTIDGREVSGIVGLVADTELSGTPHLVCEAFDVASGVSIVVAQPYRKAFLKKKRTGAIRVVGPAKPLSFTPTNPDIKRLLRQVREATDTRIAERSRALSAAGVRVEGYSSRRGGDRDMWDLTLVVDRSGKQDWLECELWQDSAACLSIEQFEQWLDQQLVAAIGPS